MAFNADGLIQSIIDSQNPTAQENRRIVRGVLAETFHARLAVMQDRYFELEARYKKAVDDETMTPESRTAALDRQQKLIDSYQEFIDGFLKNRS